MLPKVSLLLITFFGLLNLSGPASAGPNANATVSLDLIVDGGTGNQTDDGVTSGTVSGQGTKIAVEVFAKGVATPLSAVIIKFNFDASVLKVEKVENSAFSPILDATGATFLAFSPVTLPPSGFLARAEFSTVTDVTGQAFTLGIGTVGLQTTTSKDDVTTTDVISFNANNANPSPDFDGNGVVGIPDFLQFVDHFGTSRGDAGYDAKYDLDGNDTIGVSDFLIFVDSFGKAVSPSGGGGSGGGSSIPDLIVESPSVSDGTLTTGQSFTLRATVRNQGTGSAASTTLRYYRSSNSTISTSDTQVGTDSVSGLSASGTSAESISLTAPSSAGTYYYGACVNSVTGESDTGNNCSDAVTITVSSSSGGGGGGPPIGTDFDLDSDNGLPTGITYANNRFYVVDQRNEEKVYVYTMSGQRDTGADFDLDSDNSVPTGITYANNRFYVVDWDKKVYVYTMSGQRDTGADFDLDSDNGLPEGITYANNRFYVVDSGDDKVYVYTMSGQRDTGADFNLESDNGDPDGITYANNRLYVVDARDDKVYVYTMSGQRDTGAEFDLESDKNFFGGGITYANNRLYVVDLNNDKVYVYTMSGQSVSAGGGSGSGGGGGSSSPDLIVESPSVSYNTLATGQSFTLRATVRNQGTGSAAATTLRYYRSSNSTISTSDIQVGTDSVSGLSASGTSAESISLNAPSSAGTYYYGACVASVSGESNTDNNCSDGVRVTVISSGGGGGGTSPPSGDAVTGSITDCSATENAFFIYDLRIKGTVRANRSVSNLSLRGYIGSSFLGSISLGSMSAGQSKNYTFLGTSFSTPSGRCRVEMTWREGGNKSQGVVDEQ